MRLLLLNAGSSSLKFSVVDSPGEQTQGEGEIELGSPPFRFGWRATNGAPVSDQLPSAEPAHALRRILAEVRVLPTAEGASSSIAGVVHRVVHGGARFRHAVVVDAGVRTELGALADLAPLHNPPSLAVIDAAMDVLVGTPQIAVFDTAFHASLPREAFTYPIPFEWTERWELRRYGFHGLSHAYCAERASELAGERPHGRIVVAHLGNGSSVTAVRDGVSIDTSMGFTPLEGLMMGTRCGSIDPGLLLHLQATHGLSVETVSHALNFGSGLRGVSGVSSDMRQVLDAANAGHQRAELAVRMFVHRARHTIGGLVVTLGGVDALVFTGGIGQHSPTIRAAICDGLACLGLDLDAEANSAPEPDAIVSRPSSGGLILVVRTREDVMMARAAMALMTLARQGS